MAMRAKASLLFCPPESEAIGLIANSPVTPKEPRYDRYSSSFMPAGKSNKIRFITACMVYMNVCVPGNLNCMKCSGVDSMTSWST